MKKISAVMGNVFVERVKEWLVTLVDRTPNIVLALLIFFAGFYSARLVKRIVIRFLSNRAVKPSARNMTGNIVSVIVVVIFFLFALDILDLDNMVKTLLAGAGVAGLAIGLALQGTLSNTFSGMTLSYINDIRIGDQIETNGYIGIIEDINLRVVKLRTQDENLVSIPNKLIIENPLKNYSSRPLSRIVLSCGVAYNSDLEKVKELVLTTLREEVDAIEKTEPIIFSYTEFADSSINFEVRFAAPSKSITETMITKSAAIIAIKKAFDRNGVNIPFPIRTLDIPQTVIDKLGSHE